MEKKGAKHQHNTSKNTPTNTKKGPKHPHQAKEETSKAISIEDFFKFPRTKHILDAGGTGVSRDDLLMEANEFNSFFNQSLIIEEKVDGSNLGISKDKDFNIIFQNRGKIITSASHTQWKGLDNWIKQHPGIWEVLTSEDVILFGEWCHYKHSIVYDRLPDYFIAFDLFIKSENKFLSRAQLEQRLATSGIPIINKISEGQVHSKQSLLALLETKSAYRSKGTVEGIYIRIDDQQYNIYRGKIVRPDFTQGIEDHWMTMTLEENSKSY